MMGISKVISVNITNTEMFFLTFRVRNNILRKITKKNPQIRMGHTKTASRNMVES